MTRGLWDAHTIEEAEEKRGKGEELNVDQVGLRGCREKRKGGRRRRKMRRMSEKRWKKDRMIISQRKKDKASNKQGLQSTNALSGHTQETDCKSNLEVDDETERG